MRTTTNSTGRSVKDGTIVAAGLAGQGAAAKLQSACLRLQIL